MFSICFWSGKFINQFNQEIFKKNIFTTNIFDKNDKIQDKFFKIISFIEYCFKELLLDCSFLKMTLCLLLSIKEMDIYWIWNSNIKYNRFRLEHVALETCIEFFQVIIIMINENFENKYHHIRKFRNNFIDLNQMFQNLLESNDVYLQRFH